MSLNVIGLVSGGKDSLFSLAHCLQNGHKLVAIANLYPGDAEDLDPQSKNEEVPDLDSFMYQTVGYSVVPLYEEALGVPLYRRPIAGSALQSERYYDTGPLTKLRDETEDMYDLIREVIRNHPEANALNAGAILSTYQRTRVESVAVRLGLVPLAYLWQYPALPPPLWRKDSLTGLLDDMERSGCDARIIKIASGGIQTDMSFSNVANYSTRTKLVSGMTPFFIDDGQEFWLRGAVLGEGGEYETLALDGPGILWRKRISIGGYEVSEAEGGTFYVRLRRVSSVLRDLQQAVDVPVPVILDQRFTVVQSRFVPSAATESLSLKMPVVQNLDITLPCPTSVKTSFNKSLSNIQIFNLTAPGATAAEQLDAIIAGLPIILDTTANTAQTPRSCLTARNIVSSMLILRSMEDFAAVNQIYTTKLWPPGLSNPPARVTIAAQLPLSAKVLMTLTYNVSIDDTKARKGLHVQSRSYWAPANIGPYSQAICAPIFSDASGADGRSASAEVVHLAGQIPLVPSTMAILNESFINQAILALQHLWRVAQERCVDLWAGVGVAYMAQDQSCTQNDQDMLERVKAAARIWELAHQIDERGHNAYKDQKQFPNGSEGEDEDEDQDIDLWDLQQQSKGFSRMLPKMTLGEHLHKLPNRLFGSRSWDRPDGVITPGSMSPCFIAAEVVGLPRAAPIEWWSTGIAGLIRKSSARSPSPSFMAMAQKALWTLSGIFLQDDTRGSHTSTKIEQDLTSDRQEVCFFTTLLIDQSITRDTVSSLPLNLQDLIPHLAQNLQNSNSLQWQVGMAHSFVNLDCPVATLIHEQSQLMQNSCIVPCNHVWASRMCEAISKHRFDETIDANSQPRSNDSGEDAIGEVAVAITMRIDAFSIL